MSMTAIEGEVRAYLAAVRAHLNDLPEDERNDLLEDLEQHLTEVRAEGEGSLIERLGPPDVYAAELRASVGITPSKTTWLSRNRDTWNRAVDNIRDFMPELRPGWWVLRGALAVAAPIAITARRDLSDYLRPRAETILGLVFVGVGIWLSVKLGRRALQSAGVRRLAVVVNLAVVLFSVVAWGVLSEVHGDVVNRMVDDAAMQVPGYLAHGDGTPIANICPYDKHGKPLKNVLLFDDQGHPLTDLADPPNAVIDQTVMPPLRNAFPLKRKVMDANTGQVTTMHCPSVIVSAQP